MSHGKLVVKTIFGIILDNGVAIQHITIELEFGHGAVSLTVISHKPEHLFATARSEGNQKPDRIAGRSSDNRETHDERLAHILGAATQVIAQVGYEKASMRLVAKAAGTSLAGMYHYFDGKERMLFLIQFRTFNSLLNNLREKLQGVTDPVEQLRVMVRAHLAYFAANMSALKVCSHELDSLTGSAYEETRRIRRDYYELTRSIIDRVSDADARGATLDRHVATMSLFGTLNWLYRWYDPKRGPSPAALANQIATQFLRGILGAEADAERFEASPDARVNSPN